MHFMANKSAIVANVYFCTKYEYFFGIIFIRDYDQHTPSIVVVVAILLSVFGQWDSVCVFSCIQTFMDERLVSDHAMILLVGARSRRVSSTEMNATMRLLNCC